MYRLFFYVIVWLVTVKSFILYEKDQRVNVYKL